MKRVFAGLSLIAGCLALGIYAGCDSEDNNDPLSGLTPGDTTSGEFQFVEGVLDEPTEGIGQSLELSLRLLENIPPMPNSGRRSLPSLAVSNDSFAVTAVNSYSFENGWHIFDYEASILSYDDLTQELDSLAIAGVDSLQLLTEGTPNGAFEIEVFDEFRVRAHRTGSFVSVEETGGGSEDHLLDVQVNVNGGDTSITVNGTLNDSLELNFFDVETECGVVVTSLSTLINFSAVVDETNPSECPLGGTVSQTVGLNLTCLGASDLDPENINGSWTVTATVNESDQSVTVTYSDGTTFWTVTGQCDDVAPPVPQ